MKNHWGNRAAALLMAGSLVGVLAACSSGEEADTEKVLVEGVPDGRPKAPPIKLPEAWDGMNGGLFEFSASRPIYTENGILTVSGVDEPVIWSWDGTSKVLKPKTDADEVAIEDSLFLDRDGKWYPVTIWRGTKNATGLGDAVVTRYVTTWDERGNSVLFQGKIDLDSLLDQNRGWSTFDGMLVHDVSAREKIKGDGRELVLNPMTGDISRGEAEKDAAARLTHDDPKTNPSLTIERTAVDAPVRITNTKTGKVTTVTREDLCDSSGYALPRSVPTVVSSFDGRYLAIGKRVIDTETDTSTCLDPAGNPRLVGITADGVGYGDGQRNGNDVIISYDFAKKEIEILPNAMVAPDFIGPNDEAVVSNGSTSPSGVYRSAR